MKRVLLAAALLCVCLPAHAENANCETARANASSASELIAKAEAAGFKLDANAKARIVACFKKPKRKHRS